MSRSIALLLCISFILFLFIMDFKRKPHVSLALWVPWFWFSIMGTRALSTWFGLGVYTDSPDYYIEGSEFDRNVLIAFIIIGIVALLRRKFDLLTVIKNNIFIFIFLLYAGLSTLWSDYTFVSFKRWIKEIGNIIMVLIVLTEPEPVEAIKTMIKRFAYVIIPLSIVFIQYFPELGRSYSVGGVLMYTGVAYGKNGLGQLCLICGLVLFWSLITMLRNRSKNNDTKEVLIHVLLLLMISWLLYMAHSATSLLGSIVGVCMLIGLGLPFVRNNVKLIKFYVPFLVLILLVIHLSFDIMSVTTSSLGRDMTLTGRTELWKQLIDMGTNPLIGTGYESFWVGDRVAKLWEQYWWHPNQAHNGYLEIYLNLGFIGLTLLMGIIYSTYSDISKNLLSLNDYDYQILRMTFLVIILAINVTEANFKVFLWLVFLLFAFKCQNRAKNPVLPHGTLELKI